MELYQQEIEQSKYELLDIKEPIRLSLQLNTRHMQFDRSHRLVAKTASKTLPIVVKFNNFQTREMVQQKSL